MSTVFLVAAPIDAQVRARGERVGDDDRKGLRRHKGDSMVPMKEGSGISGRTAALSCLVLSCLVLFLQRVPLEGFSGACRSRPTLYRAEHHTPMGRVLRYYALEPSRGVAF
jgi:hypothetical protein